jgi:hypothetical protein
MLSGKNYDFLVFRFVMLIAFKPAATAGAGVKTFQTGDVLGRLRRLNRL